MAQHPAIAESVTGLHKDLVHPEEGVAGLIRHLLHPEEGVAGLHPEEGIAGEGLAGLIRHLLHPATEAIAKARTALATWRRTRLRCSIMRLVVFLCFSCFKVDVFNPCFIQGLSCFSRSLFP